MVDNLFCFMKSNYKLPVLFTLWYNRDGMKLQDMCCSFILFLLYFVTLLRCVIFLGDVTKSILDVGGGSGLVVEKVTTSSLAHWLVAVLVAMVMKFSSSC